MLRLAALPSFLLYERMVNECRSKQFVDLQASQASLGTNGVFFALNQTIQSTEEVRTNSMENNIQHRCKYCLDMWTIVLEMLL